MWVCSARRFEGSLGLEHSYGNGPQRLLRAVSLAARGKITVNGIPNRLHCCVILGTFAEFGKANITFVVSVRPSVHIEQFCSHRTDFNQILTLYYIFVLRKPVYKIEVSLIPRKNNGYFTRIHMNIYDSIVLNSSQNEKYFRQI